MSSSLDPQFLENGESKTMPLDVVIKIPSSPGFLSSPPTTCTSPADLDIERERRETLLDSPPRQRSGSFISQKEWATESLTSFTVQVLTPFLICGFGNLGAGQLLDVVQHWPVFLTVTELYVLVPSLMGLKGNLEMTMASRLSTSANCGVIDSTKEILLMAKGNLALLQCQATVVGFLASLIAISVDVFKEGEIKVNNAFLLASSSVITANIASFLLSTVMIGVVIGSRKHNINPDNIATPIASSLGDMITVALLGCTSSFLFNKIQTEPWIAPLLMVSFMMIVPITARHAYGNKYTKRVIHYGWTPIIMAMVISSIGGVILDKAMDKFEDIAPFQPVINGVGGNLVAIQASKISTFLHQRTKPGVLPMEDKKVFQSPCAAFFSSCPHAKIARILFFVAAPAQIIYFYIIILIKGQSASIIFSTIYLSAALFQVVFLLYFARILVFWLWKKEADPDDSAIPILTATGDLLGTALLTGGFYLAHALKDSTIIVNN